MQGSCCHRVKLFRRTGRASFAVQLYGSPGVVEIHCISTDFEDASGKAKVSQSRLDSLGRENSKHTAVQPEEGLEVELGPYSPQFKAFVQCKLRVVSNHHSQSLYEYMEEPTSPDGCTPINMELHAAPGHSGNDGPMRRPFKWFTSC